MRFEYNANLVGDDYVTLVANEILDRFPLISSIDAQKIASLTQTVDDRVSNDDKFYRCYLIMKYIGPEHEEFDHVFNDAYRYYDSGLTNEKYINTMEAIIDFVSNGNGSFPDIY